MLNLFFANKLRKLLNVGFIFLDYDGAFPDHSIIIIQPQNAENNAFKVALGLIASVTFFSSGS